MLKMYSDAFNIHHLTLLPMYDQAFDIVMHAMDICFNSGAYHGQRLFDIDGTFRNLMHQVRPSLLSRLSHFECRFDSDGVACPWYVLRTGESGPVMQHSIAIRHITERQATLVSLLQHG